MSERAFSSGSLDVLIQAHMQALTVEHQLRLIALWVSARGYRSQYTESHDRTDTDFFLESHLQIPYDGDGQKRKSDVDERQITCHLGQYPPRNTLTRSGRYILPVNSEKSDCLWGGQHVAFPVKESSGFHKAVTGRHCAKVRMMAIVQKRKLPIIAP